MKKTKTSELQAVLTAVFAGTLLVSNIIAGKQLQLPFGITMTGAVIVFPITYILSDLFSEVYGYRWSRVTCYTAFGINLFMAIVFAVAIATPAPGYWQNQKAFQTVLGNTPRILFASLLAFVAGDYVNDRIFRRMKAKHPDSQKGFGQRSIISSIGGAIIDSAIFIPIAFLGEMPLKALIVMGITQVSLKLLYELLVLPLNRYITIKVAAYEAK